MKKKILFVITKSNWGGAQRYVYDLATSLPKSEFEVAVAFGGTGEVGANTGLLAERLKEKGVRTIFLPSFTRDVSLLREFRTFRELVRVFRQEKPDVIHLNSSKAVGLGALAGRISGVRKIIFTVHGWPFWESRSVVAKKIMYLFSWVTAVLAHTVITISDYDLKVAQNMLFVRHKAVRIYNGIAPMSFGTGEKIRSAFPPGARITGTIGELNKNKNQISLIQEAKNNPNMYVAIVGEGELRAWLEEKIREYHLEDRVKLFGFMPANAVLKGFDIFALPSIKEGLPYVLLEAKAAGLPIVASRVGGVGEILDAKDMSEFSLAQMLEKTTGLYFSNFELRNSRYPHLSHIQ